MSTPAIERVNPYAAPLISGGDSPEQVSLEGLWQDGEVLVMHKEATLPPICVKSGQPAADWLQRDLQWHPPWVIWTIFFALPLYIILALVLSRRATVIIGLTREWRKRHRIRMLITAGIVVAGLAVALVGILIAIQGVEYEIALWLAPIGSLSGLIGGTAYGQFACRLVWPKQISSQFVWLQGVHPEFLKLLPPWPGGEI